LPDESEVDEKKWEALMASHPDLRACRPPGSEFPTSRLERLLGERAIRHVSLLPFLKAHQAKTGGSLYYAYDGHWKPEGHAAASQAIFDHLAESHALKAWPLN